MIPWGKVGSQLEEGFEFIHRTILRKVFKYLLSETHSANKDDTFRGSIR